MSETAKDSLYTIVVPAFEEAGLIEDSLTRTADYLREQGMHDKTEVIVVAAKGRDDTAELARKHADDFTYFQLIEPGPKVGKGRDVQAGMAAARGQYVLFMDADLATPLKYLKPALETLESGKADVVIGARDLWKIHKTLPRKIMSVSANVLVRILLLPTIPDSQCGFKGFTRPVAADLFGHQTIHRWAFDMELLAIARLRNYKIVKLPIKDWSDPKLDAGLVGESPLQASVQTFKELWRIRRQRAKGMYS